jgi:hypothetical protein
MKKSFFSKSRKEHDLDNIYRYFLEPTLSTSSSYRFYPNGKITLQGSDKQGKEVELEAYPPVSMSFSLDLGERPFIVTTFTKTLELRELFRLILQNGEKLKNKLIVKPPI